MNQEQYEARLRQLPCIVGHGLHRRAFEMRYQLSDVKMLALTRQLYAKEFGA